MTAVALAALVLVALDGLLTLARLVRPGTLATRLVAVDALVIVVVNGIAVHAAWTGEDVFLDVMVVASLLGFVGTATVARFIERGHRS